MTSYLLDTSIIIDYLRGKQSAVELLNNIEGELVSSYVCLAELYEGVFRVNNSNEMEKAVNKFFSSLVFVYGLDKKVSKKFGELRALLKKKGKIIEDLDLILAATCIVNNLTLITLNQKHFSHIPDLQVHS